MHTDKQFCVSCRIELDPALKRLLWTNEKCFRGGACGKSLSRRWILGWSLDRRRRPSFSDRLLAVAKRDQRCGCGMAYETCEVQNSTAATCPSSTKESHIAWSTRTARKEKTRSNIGLQFDCTCSYHMYKSSASKLFTVCSCKVASV